MEFLIMVEISKNISPQNWEFLNTYFKKLSPLNNLILFLLIELYIFGTNCLIRSKNSNCVKILRYDGFQKKGIKKAFKRVFLWKYWIAYFTEFDLYIDNINNEYVLYKKIFFSAFSFFRLMWDDSKKKTDAQRGIKKTQIVIIYLVIFFKRLMWGESLKGKMPTVGHSKTNVNKNEEQKNLLVFKFKKNFLCLQNSCTEVRKRKEMGIWNYSQHN